ncbi:hypothetical protein IFE17_09365 [Actinobacillus sp. GY-402]|nr:hypothetical protein IFE17_09365 [Actinobacillus sp. GY-402]
MAYKMGVAQNERDLLDILNKFLTTDPTLVASGQAWTVLFDRTLPATSTQVERRQIAWKSTGTGIEQDIYICAVTDNLISADTYNINFCGGTFFNSDFINANQIWPGMINVSPRVVLFADSRPIDYIFVADGRCFKAITRISNVCSSAYCGFILPTVAPNEYPYPLCVAGSAPLLKKNPGTTSFSSILPRYSNTWEYHSSLANPLAGNCWLFTPDQSWRDFYGTSYVEFTNDSKAQNIMPHFTYKKGSYNWYVMQCLSASPGDTYPLFPVEFISDGNSSQGINRWGAYDGVYWIPGVQRAVGDEVTLPNGNKGVVCNNGYRTTTTDYFVIDLGA